MPRASSRSSSSALGELAASLVEQLAGPRGILVEAGARERELHRERHEPLLRPVVQVALDPAALEQRDLQQPGARALELLDARSQLGLQRLVGDRERGGGGHRAHEPGLLAQRRVVHDRADALTVALDERRLARGVELPQVDRTPFARDEVAGSRAPVGQLDRRVAERVGDRLAHTAGRDSPAEIPHQRLDGDGTCPISAHQADQEGIGQHRECEQADRPEHRAGVLQAEQRKGVGAGQPDDEREAGGQHGRLLTAHRRGRLATAPQRAPAHDADDQRAGREREVVPRVGERRVRRHEERARRAVVRCTSRRTDPR